MKELDLTAEEQLVLGCLRATLDPDRPLPVLDAGFDDWQGLISAAQTHRALGALLAVEKQSPGFWPAEFTRRIASWRLTMLVHAEQAVAQVASTLAELTRVGIPLVVMKGWDYIHTVYGGDYSLRPCADIDILIHPRDVKSAEEALARQKYQPYEELWPGIRFRYGNAAYHYQRSQKTPHETLYGVDLHWGLFNIRCLDDRVSIAELFSRAVSLEVGGIPVLHMGVEDHILHAAGHRSLHHDNDSEMYRFYELAWVIRHAQPGVDWTEVFSRAKEWGIRLALRSILEEIERHFPGTLPEFSSQEWVALEPDPQEARLYQTLQKYHVTPLGRLLPIRWTPKGLWETAGFLFEAFVPGPKFMEHRYGKTRIWPVLYFRRAGNAFKQLAGFLGRKPA